MYNPDDLHLRRALASRTQPFGLSHIPYTPSNQENFQKFQEFFVGLFWAEFPEKRRRIHVWVEFLEKLGKNSSLG